MHMLLHAGSADDAAIVNGGVRYAAIHPAFIC